MTLDERCTQIITVLFNSSGYVSVDRITNQLGISRRTVYYDVKKFNSWLEENQLHPVQKKHGEGYYLEQAAEKRFLSPNTLNYRGQEPFFIYEFQHFLTQSH